MTLREPEAIDIPTPSGPMRTHLFRPAVPGKYPAVVLYSEIFHMTGPIARTAAFLAGHGFLVAVPEIYHEFLPAGTVLAYDQAGSELGNRLKTEKPLANYDTDARAALDFLAAHEASTGKLGVMGICIGGHLAYRAATLPGALAGVCFYPTDLHKRGLGQGACDDSLARTPEIKGELLMVFGRQDPHIPSEGRSQIYAALSAAGTTFTWHEFNGAHAFLRDEGLRYDPEVARQALGLAVDFLRRKLA